MNTVERALNNLVASVESLLNTDDCGLDVSSASKSAIYDALRYKYGVALADAWWNGKSCI